MRKVVKAADATANTTTTPASDPELQFQIAPNQTIALWMIVDILQDNAGSVGFEIVGPSGAVGRFQWRLFGLGAVPLGCLPLNTVHNATGDSSATLATLFVEGSVTASSTGGTVALQTARFGAGNVQVKAGSMILSV